MATSEGGLQRLFGIVQEYLKKLGLAITDKCKVLVIGARCSSIVLGGVRYKPVQELRFLGLKITATGNFEPWRDDFTASMYGVKGRIVSAGLGNLPIALSRAL
jgi:hypothetical protein